LEDRVAHLQHELRVARFDGETHRQRADATARNTAAQRADLEATVSRVWALVNRRRKTLRMADLVSALEHEATVWRTRPAPRPCGS
ncbi:MAG: hypothetical protein ACREX8_05110, partial [Gammaproteobacteria bacterium]